MLIPLTIGIYLANKIFKDDGPIFYSQERMGKDGKTFTMYKYRSMVVDADEKLEGIIEKLSDSVQTLNDGITAI